MKETIDMKAAQGAIAAGGDVRLLLGAHAFIGWDSEPEKRSPNALEFQ